MDYTECQDCKYCNLEVFYNGEAYCCNPDVIAGVAKKEFDEEAFIGGIEFAIDTNLEISEEDYALYQYLVQKRAERQQVEEAMEDLRKAIAEVIKPLTECLHKMADIINMVLKSEKIQAYAKAVYEMQREQKKEEE